MTLQRAVHENLLINILQDIFTDPTVAPFVGFKGGTAAMLFYGLSRFSVDLDFDLLDQEYEEHLFKKVKEICEKYGTLKKIDKKRYSLFFLLSYHGKTDGAYNIKIDISRRNYKAEYQILTHLGIAMRVMKQDDMAANKLVAMYERLGDANRDIYDVWFFLKNNWPINQKTVEERSGIKYKEYLTMCIDSLEKFDDKSILSGLGELLTDKQKVFVKTKLKDETMFQLRLALKNADELRSN